MALVVAIALGLPCTALAVEGAGGLAAGTMPASAGGKASGSESLPFSDLDPDAWYMGEGCIERVFSRGAMSGYVNGDACEIRLFGPEDTLSRAQAVTAIWRLLGKPEPQGDTAPFPDIARQSYYEAALTWAQSANVVCGYPDGTFRPDNPVTREELVALIGRSCSGWDEPGAAWTAVDLLSTFQDEVDVAENMRGSIEWALHRSIVKGFEVPAIYSANDNSSVAPSWEDYVRGTQTHVLRPKAHVTRAEAAAMLARFDKAVVVKKAWYDTGEWDAADWEKRDELSRLYDERAEAGELPASTSSLS